MTNRTIRVLGRLAPVVLAGLALAWLAMPSGAADSNSNSREKEISELEKQIQSLNQKIVELKSQPASGPVASAAVDPGLPSDWVRAFTWRCIGPANMGGRIT